MEKGFLFIRIVFYYFFFLFQIEKVESQILPKPDHIVLVILENHGYDQIIGSTTAPYINSLANDTLSALFTQSYGVLHPSQPNYLALYSGSTQGVVDDNSPANSPFTTPNLGRQLIDLGKSYLTYSESLPTVGFNGDVSGSYARKHNPAANWMGTGTNQIPTSTNRPFSVFTSGNFDLLPTVCFVQPDLMNDMHTGTDPERITIGDSWLSTNMDSYIKWAKTTNNLFILTFDEDENTASNHITTIFVGRMIQPGHYSENINHYSVFHTIEKMYGLTLIGDTVSNPPIIDCWNENYIPNVMSNPKDSVSTLKVYPDPVTDHFYVELNGVHGGSMEIYNLKGQLIQVNSLASSKTEINSFDFPTGLYLVKIIHKSGVILGKFVKN